MLSYKFLPIYYVSISLSLFWASGPELLLGRNKLDHCSWPTSSPSRQIMSPQRPFQLRRRTNRMSWPKKFPTTSSLRKFLFSLVPSSRIWGNYRKSFFSEALFDWNQFCQNFSPEQIEFVSSLCQLSKATFLVSHYTTWLLVLVLARLYLTSIAITMMKREWDKLWCFKIWAILILPTKFIQYTAKK